MSISRSWAQPLPGLLIPGLVVMYVVVRSVHQGRRAGLLSVLGLISGALVHVTAATVALSAILLAAAAAAAAFGIVTILGAGNLMFLGLRTLWVCEPVASAAEIVPLAPRRLYTGGVLVSLSIPSWR